MFEIENVLKLSNFTQNVYKTCKRIDFHEHSAFLRYRFLLIIFYV